MEDLTKECEHKWKALGTESVTYREGMCVQVFAFIFCEKCGKIIDVEKERN